MDNCSYIYAPKYAEYHRTRGPIGDKLAEIRADLVGKGREGILESSLEEFPSSLKELKREEKKEEKSGKVPSSQWPKDFVLTDKMIEYAKGRGIVDPVDEFDYWHDNALAKGYKYLDWERAWQTWCRSTYQQTRRGPSGGNGRFQTTEDRKAENTNRARAQVLEELEQEERKATRECKIINELPG